MPIIVDMIAPVTPVRPGMVEPAPPPEELAEEPPRPDEAAEPVAPLSGV